MKMDSRFNLTWKGIKNRYFQELILLLALLVIGAVFTVLTSTFLTISNLLAVLLQISTIAILGFGVTIVIISGGIDLSLGPVIALVGMGVSSVLTSGLNSILLAIVAGIFIGALVGCINGIDIVFFKIPAFIATLAMGSIVRGVSLLVTNAIPIYNLPQSFLNLGAGSILGIPIPVFIMLLMFAILHFLLNNIRFGRYIYAIGGNEEATRLSGIKVNRTRLLVYIICGIYGGVAGVMFTARIGSGQPTAGNGYEMDAITAAILGGTSMFGGAGTLAGTLIGAFVMGVLNNGLALLNINSYVQLIIKGIIVLLAVGLSAFRYKSLKTN